MMKVTRLTYSELPEDIRSRLFESSTFSSPGFAQLWATLGGRDIYWLAESAAQPQAVLTSVEFGRWPVKRLQAMPDGLYCSLAFLSEQPEKLEHIAKAIWQAIGKSHYIRAFLTDYYRWFDSVDSSRHTWHDTLRVDVSAPGWQPPDKKIQSEIRKAERENIVVQPFDPTEHMEGFLHLMKATESRHDRRQKYPNDFFRALAELAQNDSRIDWRYVECDSRPVASHINLVDNQLLLSWQIYFDKSFSWLKPNQYLLQDAIRRHFPVGVRSLNMGATPEQAQGVGDQKAKWGGQKVQYRTLSQKSGLGWLK